MKIGEARKIYSAQLHEFQQQKLSLAKQKKELERKKKIRKHRERHDVEESKMVMGSNYGGESSKFSPVQDISFGAGISADASGDILSQIEGVDMSPVSVSSEYVSGGSAVAAEASLGTSVDVFL